MTSNQPFTRETCYDSPPLDNGSGLAFTTPEAIALLTEVGIQLVRKGQFRAEVATGTNRLWLSGQEGVGVLDLREPGDGVLELVLPQTELQQRFGPVVSTHLWAVAPDESEILLQICKRGLAFAPFHADSSGHVEELASWSDQPFQCAVDWDSRKCVLNYVWRMVRTFELGGGFSTFVDLELGGLLPFGRVILDEGFVFFARSLSESTGEIQLVTPDGTVTWKSGVHVPSVSPGGDTVLFVRRGHLVMFNRNNSKEEVLFTASSPISRHWSALSAWSTEGRWAFVAMGISGRPASQDSLLIDFQKRVVFVLESPELHSVNSAVFFTRS